MHRLVLAALILAPLARDAAAFTCPYMDPTYETYTGLACDVVVYLPASFDPTDLRLVTRRSGVEVELAASGTSAIESRDVEHTAYCGTTVVAQRTDMESFLVLRFDVTGLAEGEELRVVDPGGETISRLVVDANEPCITEPLMDTWCGSTWPGECSEEPGDPNDPGDPDDPDDDGGCAAGGSASALVGFLVLPWLRRGRRREEHSS